MKEKFLLTLIEAQTVRLSGCRVERELDAIRCFSLSSPKPVGFISAIAKLLLSVLSFAVF
jgi:hypothetical protein